MAWPLLAGGNCAHVQREPDGAGVESQSAPVQDEVPDSQSGACPHAEHGPGRHDRDDSSSRGGVTGKPRSVVAHASAPAVGSTLVSAGAAAHGSAYATSESEATTATYCFPLVPRYVIGFAFT